MAGFPAQRKQEPRSKLGPQAHNTVYVCEWTRYYFDSIFSCSIWNSFLADALNCIRANGKGIHVRVHSHGIELHL